MQSIAKAKNGKCLSKTYVNNLTKLKSQCSEEHVWYERPSQIKKGTWCPQCVCGGRLKVSLCRNNI